MSKATKGVIWSAVERFSVQGVSFILGIVIARLVTPEEYGLIAMLSIFMAISQAFVDSGFGNALIQKKDRNDTDYATVFYFNIVIAIILYIILYLCAPLIARFYNQPQLTSITRFIGINLILNSLSIVQRTILTVNLNFKHLAKISLTAVIISGVIGIIMAYKGWGVWALVAQSLSNQVLITLLLWVSARWYPLWAFSIQSFKRLFSFGSKLLASGLLHTIYINLYSLVIGKFYNPSDVGYYNRASSISQYPSTNIVSIINRAIYPVQCAHQDDEAWLELMFIKYLRMACFIVFPLMGLLAVIAAPLVKIILTDKWLPAAPLISILSMAYIWYPILVVNNQILNVKGRSDLFLRAEIIKKIMAIIILCTTLPFGIIWLCIGLIIYNIFDMVFIIYYSKKVINIGYLSQFKSVFIILMLTAISGSGSYFLSSIFSDSWIQLLTGCLVFITIYITGSRILKLDEMRHLKSILHS